MRCCSSHIELDRQKAISSDDNNIHMYNYCEPRPSQFVARLLFLLYTKMRKRGATKKKKKSEITRRRNGGFTILMWKTGFSAVLERTAEKKKYI